MAWQRRGLAAWAAELLTGHKINLNLTLFRARHPFRLNVAALVLVASPRWDSFAISSARSVRERSLRGQLE